MKGHFEISTFKLILGHTECYSLEFTAPLLLYPVHLITDEFIARFRQYFSKINLIATLLSYWENFKSERQFVMFLRFEKFFVIQMNSLSQSYPKLLFSCSRQKPIEAVSSLWNHEDTKKSPYAICLSKMRRSKTARLDAHQSLKVVNSARMT